MSEPLVEAFRLGGHELVAFVGAGGKTTLTLGIAEELTAAKRPVVVTTTTKMGSDQVPDRALVCRTIEKVDAAIRSGRPAFLAGEIGESKVIGVDPVLVDEVFALRDDVSVVVEADGARRRSFKAPGPGEPVIPSSATLVVVVVGVDAIGGRIGDVCHRPERVVAITGTSFNHTLTVADVGRVVSHPEGGRTGVPAGASLVCAVTRITAEHTDTRASLRQHLDDDIELVAVTNRRP